MVTGAVVVSSQTTSTRAANLLASFIIIPMTLIINGEIENPFTYEHDHVVQEVVLAACGYTEWHGKQTR